MTDYGHSLGLKVGWYGNNCICKEHYLKNETEIQNHYVGDAQAHIDYGFDSTKLDNCG